MDFTGEEIAKLPKWAQRKVQTLMANLKSANRENERNLGDYDPDYPTYGDYNDLRGRSLPCRQVWFRNAGITVSVSGGDVEVYGDGRLTILPQVTNRIKLRSDRIDSMP